MILNRIFLGNVFKLASSNLTNLIVPIVTIPILTKSIGLENYGQYVLFMTILTFGQTIIDYSSNLKGIRDISFFESDVKKIFTSYFIIRLFMLLVFILITVLFYLAYDKNVTDVFAYVFPYSLGYLLLSSWFLQYKNQMSVLLWYTLFTKLLLLFGILFFISNKSDYKLLLLITSLPTLIWGGGVFIIKKHYTYLSRKIAFSDVYDLYVSGVNIFLGLLTPNLYNSIPLMIVGAIFDKKEFATYAIASKLCGIVYSFISVIGRAAYPIICRNNKSKELKDLIFINLSLTSISFLFISFLSEFLLEYFFHIDTQNNIYFVVLSLSLIFVGLSNAMTIGYIFPNGLDRIYRNHTVIISIFSSMLVYFLIIEIGILGCAIGLLCARVLLCFSYAQITYSSIKNGRAIF